MAFLMLCSAEMKLRNESYFKSTSFNRVVVLGSRSEVHNVCGTVIDPSVCSLTLAWFLQNFLPVVLIWLSSSIWNFSVNFFRALLYCFPFWFCLHLYYPVFISDLFLRVPCEYSCLFFLSDFPTDIRAWLYRLIIILSFLDFPSAVLFSDLFPDGFMLLCEVV